MALEEFIARYKLSESVYVTRPTMPSREDYLRMLAPVWEQRWLTNEGPLHARLERALAEHMEVAHLSLFCNGTTAMLLALQAMDITEGEVITTPFTFPATAHVIHWNRLTPVFCDIREDTCALDPEAVEAAITPRTRAILGVHTYGFPCDVEALEAIAARRGLRLLYDAAPAFGVRCKGRSILQYGDMSVLSFHATKLFTTAEGGAVATRNADWDRRIRFLKNFGIADEETVIGPGINGKMSELQAAFGLLQLEQVGEEIARRGAVAAVYRERLAGVRGIRLFPEPADATMNHAYFPIRIIAGEYGADRDALNVALRKCNIIARKYYFPLCSHFPCYADLPSADPRRLPVAERMSAEVLCLPIYGTLSPDIAATIADAVASFPDVNETDEQR